MGLFFFVYGASQMAGFDPIQKYHSWADHRPVAFFGQHTLYAPVAATCFAAALLQRKFIFAALLLVPAFLIDSSFSYLSFGVAVLAFLVKEFKWKALIAPALLVVCLFIMKKVMYDSYTELYNPRGRFSVWSQTVDLANKRMAFGYGVSTFKQIYPVFQNPQARFASGIKDEALTPKQLAFMKEAEKMAIESGYFFNPHNEYLNVYFEGGLLGLFLVFCIFFVFYTSFALLPKTPETWFLFTTFSIFVGNSVGNFPMHLIPQALFPIWAFVVMTTRRKWTIMEVYEYATRNIRTIPSRTTSV